MIRALLLLAFLFCALASFAQVGIGTTTPHPSAQLDVVSTNKGLLVPRVANTSDVTGTPAKGLVVYQTSGSEGFYVFDGASWQKLVTAAETFTPAFVNGYKIGTRVYNSLTKETFGTINVSGFTLPNMSTFSPLYDGTYLISYKVAVLPGSQLQGTFIVVNDVLADGTFFQSSSSTTMIAVETIIHLSALSQVSLVYNLLGPTQITYASLTLTRLK